MYASLCLPFLLSILVCYVLSFHVIQPLSGVLKGLYFNVAFSGKPNFFIFGMNLRLSCWDCLFI